MALKRIFSDDCVYAGDLFSARFGEMEIAISNCDLHGLFLRVDHVEMKLFSSVYAAHLEARVEDVTV